MLDSLFTWFHRTGFLCQSVCHVQVSISNLKHNWQLLYTFLVSVKKKKHAIAVCYFTKYNTKGNYITFVRLSLLSAVCNREENAFSILSHLEGCPIYPKAFCDTVSVTVCLPWFSFYSILHLQD